MRLKSWAVWFSIDRAGFSGGAVQSRYPTVLADVRDIVQHVPH